MKTFWNRQHPRYKEYKDLYDILVPSEGKAETHEGEMLCCSRLWWMNNLYTPKSQNTNPGANGVHRSVKKGKKWSILPISNRLIFFVSCCFYLSH